MKSVFDNEFSWFDMLLKFYNFIKIWQVLKKKHLIDGVLCCHQASVVLGL